jgi:signal transduction histidine kinase
VRDTRLHSTSKTQFLGSGLGMGLAIARGLVKAHGGFLWVESEGYDEKECPGSCFHILLPIVS